MPQQLDRIKPQNQASSPASGRKLKVPSSVNTTNNMRLLLVLVAVAPAMVRAANEFRFDGNPLPRGAPEETEEPGAAGRPNSSLVWQPLRATFRPLNRQSPPPPSPPPETAALVNSDSFGSDSDSVDLTSTIGGRFSFPPPPQTTSSTTTTTPAPPTSTTSASSLDDEDQPTRVPSNRFRPTKPPSSDAQSQPTASLFAAPTASRSHLSSNNITERYRMTNECFECICEASTSCNVNSRCQTSDVRHTRCGLFLISYDQWLETGLSRELVTREALARDPAADERAFYECVTERDCAERLLTIYMQKNGKDCDRDGKIDCYDLAAIHQGGVDQCNGESLLDSQYWSDFNSCFGFER